MNTLLVNKPQFHTDNLKVGTPIEVYVFDKYKAQNSTLTVSNQRSFSFYALVTESTPLVLTMMTVGDNRQDEHYKLEMRSTLNVADVASGSVKIYKLQRVPEDEK